MRKIFEYFGLICLICFSFFITEKTSNVIQEIDTIMIKIKEEKDNYYVSGMSAKITDKFIVPGLAYKEVNVGKSYDVMSKKGIYDESFYVYNLTEPEISITNNYDKYIKEGNKEKKMVSLVFMIDNRNILDIQKVVGNTPVSYIIDSYNIDSQVSELAQISKIDSDILINNTNENNYKLIINKLNSLDFENIHCFNELQNEEYLLRCADDSKYSISTPLIVNSPLKYVKNNLKAGSIFTFKVNDILINELPNVINYIESRGYKITTLTNHLSENW